MGTCVRCILTALPPWFMWCPLLPSSCVGWGFKHHLVYFVLPVHFQTILCSWVLPLRSTLACPGCTHVSLFQLSSLSQWVFHSGFRTGLPTIHLCSCLAFSPHYRQNDIFRLTSISRLTSTSSEPQNPFNSFHCSKYQRPKTFKVLCVLDPLTSPESLLLFSERRRAPLPRLHFLSHLFPWVILFLHLYISSACCSEKSA